MFVDYLEDLCTKFKMQFGVLDKQKITDKGILDAVNNLDYSFDNVFLTIDSVMNKKGNISPEDSMAISNSFKSIMNNYRKLHSAMNDVYTANGNDMKAVANAFGGVKMYNSSTELLRNFDNASVALDFYSKKFEDIASGKVPANQTAGKVFEDNSWIANLTKHDPNKEKLKGKLPKDMPYQEHALSDNLLTYKETYLKLKKLNDQHMSTLTGEKNGLVTMNNRLNFIKDVLKSYNDEKIDGFISQAETSLTSLDDDLNPNKIREFKRENIVDVDWFDPGIEKIFDADHYRRQIMESSVSEETKNALIGLIDNMEFKTSNIGVDVNTVSILTNSIQPIRELLMSENTLVTQNEDPELAEGETYTPIEIKDATHPRHNVALAYNKIKEQFLKYLQSPESDTREIVNSFETLFKEFTKYVENADFYNPKTNEYDDMIIYLPGVAETYAALFPEKIEDKAVTKETRELASLAKKTVMDKLYTVVNDIHYSIADEKTDSENIKNRFGRLREIAELEELPDEMYDKTYFLCLAKSPSYRKEELDKVRNCIDVYRSNGIFNSYPEGISGKHAKKFRDDEISNRVTLKHLLRIQAYCRFLDNELEYSGKFSPAETDRYSRVTNGSNDAISAISRGYGISPAEADSFDELRTKLESGKAFQDLLNADDKTMAEFIADNNEKAMNNIIYGTSNPMANFNENDLKALTQNSGNLYSKNSEEYENIGKSINAYIKNAHSLNGSGNDDYKKVYDSLLKYLQTHNSVPSSDNGKLRVDAAARMMVQIGFDMLASTTDKQTEDKILRDFKVQMIRNRAFRDACTQNASKLFEKHLGGLHNVSPEKATELSAGARRDLRIGFAISSFATQLEKSLAPTYKGAIIAGKCATVEEENIILLGAGGRANQYSNLSGRYFSDGVAQNMTDRIDLRDGSIISDTLSNMLVEDRNALLNAMVNAEELDINDKTLRQKKAFASLIAHGAVKDKIESMSLPGDEDAYNKINNKDSINAEIGKLMVSKTFEKFFIEHRSERELNRLAVNNAEGLAETYADLYNKFEEMTKNPDKNTRKTYESAKKEAFDAAKPKNIFEDLPIQKVDKYPDLLSRIMPHAPYYASEEEMIQAFKEVNDKRKLLSYDEFRKAVDSKSSFKDIPRFSEREIKQRMELRERALEAEVKRHYNRHIVNLPEDVKGKFSSNLRSLSSFFGMQDRKMNKESVNVLSKLAFGTPEEKKAVCNDAFKRFISAYKEDMFNKQYTDDELVKVWPEMSKIVEPLGMELENALKFIKSNHIEVDQKLLGQVQDIAKQTAPFYTQYSLRISTITSEYGMYLPDDFEMTQKAHSELESVGRKKGLKDPGIVRTSRSNDKNFVDLAQFEYTFVSSPHKQGKTVSAIYLEDGTLLGNDMKKMLEDVSFAEKLRPGVKFVTFYENDEIPHVISTKDRGMPPKITDQVAEKYKYYNDPDTQARKSFVAQLNDLTVKSRSSINSMIATKTNIPDSVIPEEIATTIYLRHVSVQLPSMNKEDIDKALGENKDREVERLKPVVKSICRNMTNDQLEKIRQSGDLEKVVESQIKQSIAKENEVKNNLDKNSAKLENALEEKKEAKSLPNKNVPDGLSLG